MNNTPRHYERFTNLEALEALCKSAHPFLLKHYIGSAQDKHLKLLADRCINAPPVQGVVFEIEKENQDFGDLFFLKTIIERFLNAEKQVGLWGVPECVPRKLLGGYLYMKYRHHSIAQKPPEQAKATKKHMLEICDKCIDQENCIGLGKRNAKTYKPITKKRLAPQTPGQEQPQIEFDSTSLAEKHTEFIRHCRSLESPTATRRVYYATNIDYHSKHSYPNRFIYQCDYLGPEEYQLEYSFLKKQASNHSYIELLESISDIDVTSQIAYSLAEKDGRTRESFYMFVSKQYGTKLLDDFGIRYEPPQTPDMQFIGAGIDVIDKNPESYKIYFRSPKSFIIRYFEAFDVDISKLPHNSHYMVLRLDKNQQLVSFKIEMLFVYKDLPILKPLLENYDYFHQQLKHTGQYNIAVEFEQDSISKVNVYHQQRLPG